MRENKKKMINGLIDEFTSIELYDVIGDYGRPIFEEFVEAVRIAASKIKINKRAIDHQMPKIFEDDATGRRMGLYLPRDGTAYRPLRNYETNTIDVMYRVILGEMHRRTRIELGDNLRMWEDIERTHDIHLNQLIKRPWCHYLNDKYGTHYPSVATKVERTAYIDEYLRSEMFRFTSNFLKERNEKGYGFSFSDTLMCVAPRMIGKREYGKGRNPTRHAMAHMCPKLPTPERMMIRPINDMTIAPAFFCKHCKERLTDAHKTFYKLMMIGRKV